jgi:ankyrin repeat protein
MQTASAEDARDIFALANAGDAVGVEQALAAGTDVNTRDKLGQTPIVVAALAGQNEVASVLVQHGADVMARTDKGMTALHAAAFVGDVEAINLLLSGGAKVNDQDNFAHISPLHAAAEENHVSSVEALIKAGVDPSLVDVKGYTASTLAGWKQNWDVVQVLVNHGDVCQPEAIAGPWVFKKCTELTPRGRLSTQNPEKKS